MGNTEQEIKSYIKSALEDQHFFKWDINLTSASANSGGFASHITFATVSVATEEGVEDSVEVAVKSSKHSLMQTGGSLYGREAYVYKTIFPEFEKFQAQNNIKDIFDSVPKCYKSIFNEAMEVIVMENLKKMGYVLYDRKKPLDLNHLKLVLREYGKFHAISFALRSKHKADFDKLVTNFGEMMYCLFTQSFKRIMQQRLQKAYGIVREMSEKEDYETFYKVVQKGADVAMTEILDAGEPESAILHGDCWANNFLYKYEDCGVPSKVAILDWQVSRLHSPVLDLSYFLYASCSEEELKHFDELLDIYYTSFSAFLRDLGCDPEELFPYSTLRKHWKKYSLFGVLMSTTFLHVVVCDNAEIPDFDGCSNQDDFMEKLENITLADDSQYRNRLVAIINHYCNFYDKP